MSKVVKAFSVVDERLPTEPQKIFTTSIEEEISKNPVIKKQMFHYRENPYADQNLILPDKQGYIDELNRIKVEIAEANAELRRLGGQISDAVEEQNRPQPEKKPEIEEEPDGVTVNARAENLLNEAKAAAEALLDDARAEGKRLADEAKSRGYLDGFEQGFAQAENEFKSANEPKIAELNSLLEQLSSYKEEMIAQNERDLVSLAMSVAKKVIGKELKSDPRLIATMLYQELDRNRREEDIRITISPELMPAEGKASAEIKKLITQTAPNALIYVDEDSAEGTCYVETGKGITDMSIDTQLENIEELMMEE